MSHMTRMSFDHWMRVETYVGQGCEKGTKKEAVLYFFFEGLSPWMKSIGYKWSRDEDVIAAKFLRFCYEAEYALTKRRTISLLIPEPTHRNYSEDRDTFDYFVTTDHFNELIDRWSNTIPIIVFISFFTWEIKWSYSIFTTIAIFYSTMWIKLNCKY